MIEAILTVTVLSAAISWGEYSYAKYYILYQKTHDELTSVLLDMKER